MRHGWIVMAMALALGGCDSGSGGETKVRSIKVGATNPYHERMQQLSPMDRGLALRRALQDSGQRCQVPIASAYQSEYRSLKLWTLRCSDSGDWAIFLGSTGDVQVRRCTELTKLNLPPCVVAPLDEQTAQ